MPLVLVVRRRHRRRPGAESASATVAHVAVEEVAVEEPERV